MRLGLVTAVALLGLVCAAPASAAAPPNDAPGGAVDVAPFGAENGLPLERTGQADLSEAGPDAGVPRCLGPRSFARTVWFRVPSADAPQRLRVDALTPAGQANEGPELAVFVQPASGTQTREPQACDGPASQGDVGTRDPAAGVELLVPAGRTVLVQAGRPEGQTAQGVLVTVATTAVEGLAAPLGDLGTLKAPRVALGRSSSVALGGARLTEEDPAQPSCAAAGSVWRRVTAARTGTHVVAARGPGVATVTAFAGRRPTGDGALACGVRESGQTVSAAFRARRGQALWLRVGTDATGATPGASLAVSGPCDVQPLTRPAAPKVRVLSVRGRRVRVRVTGGCARSVRVVLRRGGRTVASSPVRAIVTPGTRTLVLRRSPGAGRRVSVRVTGRDGARRTRALRASRSITAR
ncbi:hypothetical protein [Conexibacter sp. SYSU D00693]|uniref:hypothetical protein n=1 Tax=Conexibacter sp. SYSU D00693 TaxID=2812560 RepID=UPI00196B93E5|nr:hypothetical protein [Conexibacter sp. SYSU D00693]